MAVSERNVKSLKTRPVARRGLRMGEGDALERWSPLPKEMGRAGQFVAVAVAEGKAPGIFRGLGVPGVVWLGLLPVACSVMEELMKLTRFCGRMVADGEDGSCGTSCSSGCVSGFVRSG